MVLKWCPRQRDLGKAHKISTAGWHLALIIPAKFRRPFSICLFALFVRQRIYGYAVISGPSCHFLLCCILENAMGEGRGSWPIVQLRHGPAEERKCGARSGTIDALRNYWGGALSGDLLQMYEISGAEIQIWATEEEGGGESVCELFMCERDNFGALLHLCCLSVSGVLFLPVILSEKFFFFSFAQLFAS